MKNKTHCILFALSAVAASSFAEEGNVRANTKENVKIRLEAGCVITACDLNNDGELSESELQLYKYCVDVYQSDRQYDRQNATGPRNLTAQEALKNLGEFRMSFDTDGSGTLEPKEAKAMHEKVRTTTINNLLTIAKAKAAQKGK